MFPFEAKYVILVIVHLNKIAMIEVFPLYVSFAAY